MQEPFATRDWDRHHSAFNADLATLFDKLAMSFRRLVAIQYDAPWERKTSRTRKARRPGHA